MGLLNSDLIFNNDDQTVDDNYCGLSSKLSCVLTHNNNYPHIEPCGRYSYYPHCADEDIELQTG